MRLFEVKPEEVGRIDLFLMRVVGEYNEDWDTYIRLYNPNVNFQKFSSGIVLRVPTKTEIDGLLSTRNLFLLSFEG